MAHIVRTSNHLKCHICPWCNSHFALTRISTEIVIYGQNKSYSLLIIVLVFNDTIYLHIGLGIINRKGRIGCIVYKHIGTRVIVIIIPRILELACVIGTGYYCKQHI